MKSALLAVLLAGLAAACSGDRGNEREAEAGVGEVQRAERARVRTAPVVQREMVSTLETTTVVESEKEIEIVPRINGVVIELHVEEGDHVRKGDVLCVLDQREAEANLEDARIALQEAREEMEKATLMLAETEALEESGKLSWDQAKRDYERNLNTGLISDRDLDGLLLEQERAYRTYKVSKIANQRAVQEEKSSHTTIARSELALEREELNYSYTKISAPFAGVIARRNVRIGDTLTGSEAAFVLTDIENLLTVFQRPQRELPLFAAVSHQNAENGHGTGPDIEITARAEALPEREFRARIELVSPSIDPLNGAFRVTARLVSETDTSTLSRHERLLPGMLVRLKIVTARHAEAKVVPKRALRREGDQRFLFVVREGTAHKILVEEGFSDEDHVEIRPLEEAQLEVGEGVVIAGSAELEDGDEVLDEAEEKQDEEKQDSEAPGSSEPEDSEPSEESPSVAGEEQTPQSREKATDADGQDSGESTQGTSEASDGSEPDSENEPENAKSEG